MSQKVAILVSAKTAADIEKILAGVQAQLGLLQDVLAGATRKIGMTQAPVVPGPEAPPQEFPEPPQA